MLITCPECKLQVSDKAAFCPHCGYPFSDVPLRRASRARKRLPNGFGQITKLTGKNLRNPYRAMVTVGKTPEGRPISKLLRPNAYFKTYNDAYAALVEYNKNPYDFTKDITVNELFEKWMAQYEAHPDRIVSTKSAWKYCHEIYNLTVRELRPRHIKYVLENGTVKMRGTIKRPTPSTQNILKDVFNMMLDMAIEYDLVERNVSRELKGSRIKTSGEQSKKFPHKAFSDKEFEDMKRRSETGDLLAASVLIQCYTGFRPTELLNMKKSKVDLDNWSIREGMKTENGKDRIVPIHPAIRELIKRIYDIPSESDRLFFWYKNYDKYRYEFQNMFPDHRPHDPRKHFATMAKKANVNEYAIKRIMGHRIEDITESVYTERDLSWLQMEISKIP